MKILGIESSCDETAAALLQVRGGRFQVLNNLVFSQIKTHQQYGGIVPEVAARLHLEVINQVIAQALGPAQKPDLIAVTKGPGLVTSLAVGVQTAKTLSYIWQIPLIGVNHLESHLWSFLLNSKPQAPISKKILKYKSQNAKKFGNWDLACPGKTGEIGICLPAVALIVSGGHTELILVKGVGKYKLIGQTLDDAAGEAFDKVAKMLGLGYPGGPIIAHFAAKGDKSKINFPRPLLYSADFDFSFSGLKTSVKYHLRDMAPTGAFSQSFINDVCASFQAAVIDVLTAKTMAAALKFKAKSIFLGGGVSANESLVASLGVKAAEQKLNFYYPERWLTGDNAAMVALAGYFNFSKAKKSAWQNLQADANLRLIK